VLVEHRPVEREAAVGAVPLEHVIAPVSATRSGPLMPRQTIAIAIAPTCASVTAPSVMPATNS
jgi:hypothetical protein